MLDVQQRVRMAQREVVGPRQVPREVRPEPQRQRDERREQREACARAASAGGTASTSNAGAHSASTTFWSRCAHRNVCSANGCSLVANAAKTSASATPRREARRPRGAQREAEIARTGTRTTASAEGYIALR